jgi:hypothetical protein
MHRFRFGGATAAAQNDTPARLFRIHGRWKSDKAKNGYALENLQKRLSIS